MSVLKHLKETTTLLFNSSTEGKEAKYIQIHHIVGKLTANKKATEDHIKEAEFEFILDLKPAEDADIKNSN